MQKIKALFRKEILQNFNTPIGYTFIVLFLLIESFVFFYGFKNASFWDRNSSEMEVFFMLAPILFLVFIPSIGMRIWSDEKETGTWELLLTLPITEWEIVLGKFLATCFSFIAALICTVFIPLTISVLGDPDWGVIFSGYVGMILLGIAFSSVVLYVSLFVKSQITSFLVGFVSLGIMYLLGIQKLVDILDTEYFGWLGIFSISKHYETFRLGIFDPRSFYFFFSLTAVFLYLSVIHLQKKR